MRWAIANIMVLSGITDYTGSVVRQAVLYQNRFVLTVLIFWSHNKGWGLLYMTCGNYIRKLAFL
jgi:hypothetical protein